MGNFQSKIFVFCCMKKHRILLKIRKLPNVKMLLKSPMVIYMKITFTLHTYPQLYLEKKKCALKMT